MSLTTTAGPQASAAGFDDLIWDVTALPSAANAAPLDVALQPCGDQGQVPGIVAALRGISYRNFGIVTPDAPIAFPALAAFGI